jgi:hypothetical protein
MQELSREAFNTMLDGVDIALEPQQEVRPVDPDNPTMDERDAYWKRRYDDFMERWARLQLTVSQDPEFNPTMMASILVDERTGNSATVQMNMSREEFVYWIEQSKAWALARGHGGDDDDAE